MHAGRPMLLNLTHSVPDSHTGCVLLGTAERADQQQNSARLVQANGHSIKRHSPHLVRCCS
jgi:hypothetical protein